MMETFGHIEELAMHEVIIRNYLMMHRQGTLTKEQALIKMVLKLTEQKNGYFNEVLKLHQNMEPKRGGLVAPDGGNYPLKWMTEPKEEASE